MDKIEEYKIKKNLQENMISYLDPEVDGKYLHFQFTDEPGITLCWDSDIIKPHKTLRAFIAKHLCIAIENNKDMLIKEAIAEARKDVEESLYACEDEAIEILNFIKEQSEELDGK